MMTDGPQELQRGVGSALQSAGLAALSAASGAASALRGAETEEGRKLAGFRADDDDGDGRFIVR